MMIDLIKIENLGKKYVRHWNDVSTGTLKESLFRSSPNKNEEFWAIRNINFSANGGDVVGLVGPNGSGKTTLLNIIAQVTEPTEGRIIHRGRVGSILGADTGFYADLNGIDNIYLSASIMGCSRKFIKKNLEEIIEFSEIKDFIYEPVKRLSSGMRMKLAVSIVLTMYPEILIFDEVIAVIDENFRDKMYKKLTASSLNDRVIFIVNHNKQFMNEKCNKILDLTNLKK